MREHATVGAEGGTRTLTPGAQEPKSCVSTDSTTPASSGSLPSGPWSADVGACARCAGRHSVRGCPLGAAQQARTERPNAVGVTVSAPCGVRGGGAPGLPGVGGAHVRTVRRTPLGADLPASCAAAGAHGAASGVVGDRVDTVRCSWRGAPGLPGSGGAHVRTVRRTSPGAGLAASCAAAGAHGAGNLARIGGTRTVRRPRRARRQRPARVSAAGAAGTAARTAAAHRHRSGRARPSRRWPPRSSRRPSPRRSRAVPLPTRSRR